MVKFTKEGWVNLSEHKVPQNVESEDKILGPFSFRQFIYLLVAVGAGFAAFALGRIAIPLAILPMPVIALFLVLALPLKKDQTMEKYLAAIIKFLFMPHLRVWIPGEAANGIEITAPSLDDDPIATKVQGDMATQRLSYLAEIEDTQGRGGFAQTNLNDEYADLDAKTPDILDENAVSESLAKRLDARDRAARAAAMAQLENSPNPPSQNDIPRTATQNTVTPQSAANLRGAQNPQPTARAMQNMPQQTPSPDRRAAAPQTFAAPSVAQSSRSASLPQNPQNSQATPAKNLAPIARPQNAPQNPQIQNAASYSQKPAAPQNRPPIAPKPPLAPKPVNANLRTTDIDSEQAVENLLSQSRAAASATNIAPNGRVVQPLSEQNLAKKPDENDAKKAENPSPAPEKNAENVKKIENANLADFTQKLRDQVAQNLKNSAKKPDENDAPAPGKNSENPSAKNENAPKTADENNEDPGNSSDENAQNEENSAANEKNATMESESAISAPDDDAAAADYAVSDDGMELDLH